MFKRGHMEYQALPAPPSTICIYHVTHHVTLLYLFVVDPRYNIITLPPSEPRYPLWTQPLHPWPLHWGKLMGFVGVGVWVGRFVPQQNPYP